MVKPLYMWKDNEAVILKFVGEILKLNNESVTKTDFMNGVTRNHVVNAYKFGLLSFGLSVSSMPQNILIDRINAKGNDVKH